MGYVVYTSHVSVRERKRTPLGKLTSWLYRRLAGTFIQKHLSFLIGGSVVVRYTTAITIGLLIGAMFDFSIQLCFPTAPPISAACLCLGATAGLAAGGGPGISIGAIWGWLIGGIVDSIASEVTSSTLPTIRSKAFAWCATCLIGWWISLFAEWCFNKLSAKSERVHRFIVRVFVLLPLVSIAAFLHCVISWSFTNFPIAAAIVHLFQQKGYLILVVTCGVISTSMLGLSLLFWWYKKWNDRSIYSLNPFGKFLGNRTLTRYLHNKMYEHRGYFGWHGRTYWEFIVNTYERTTIVVCVLLLLASIILAMRMFVE